MIFLLFLWDVRRRVCKAEIVLISLAVMYALVILLMDIIPKNIADKAILTIERMLAIS